MADSEVGVRFDEKWFDFDWTVDKGVGDGSNGKCLRVFSVTLVLSFEFSIGLLIMSAFLSGCRSHLYAQLNVDELMLRDAEFLQNASFGQLKTRPDIPEPIPKS